MLNIAKIDENYESQFKKKKNFFERVTIKYILKQIAAFKKQMNIGMVQYLCFQFLIYEADANFYTLQKKKKKKMLIYEHLAIIPLKTR